MTSQRAAPQPSVGETVLADAYPALLDPKAGAVSEQTIVVWRGHRVAEALAGAGTPAPVSAEWGELVRVPRWAYEVWRAVPQALVAGALRRASTDLEFREALLALFDTTRREQTSHVYVMMRAFCESADVSEGYP